MSFNAKELKAARVRRGLTQKSMAAMLETSVNNYNQKENGVRRFFLGEVEKIADILQLTQTEIMRIFFAD